jgi:ABC-type transporter Mla maintaining outer membrane lipid asymmetry permease subunit MlaE
MAAGIIGRRPKPNRPSTRRNPVSVARLTAPIAIVSASATGAVATITFDQVIALVGTPTYTTDLPGVTVVSATQTGPTTIAVTFSGALTSATKLNIPYDEPAVRSKSGGFVSTSTFPV